MEGHRNDFFRESYPMEVRDVQQTEDSSPVASSFPNSEKKKSDLSYIPHEKTPGDTSSIESVIQTTGSTEHTEDVDKISIYVNSAGKKTIEISIFPLEKISYLLQEACSQLNKKPENMSLIFQGEPLDLTNKVSHYPNLRRGKKVNLIRTS